MSYIGNEPIVSATRTVTEITATAGQTVFTANGGYTVGYLDVFVNGAQLQNTDFTATDGSSVTLSSAAQSGDDIRLVAWGTFQTSGALTSNNPSYTGTLTGGTGVVNIGSGQVYKDASGNVGVGTSSPATKLEVVVNGGSVSGALVSNTTGSEIGLSHATGAGPSTYSLSLRTTGASLNGISGSAFASQVISSTTSSNALELYTTGATPVVLGTGSTERMRIDSSGALLVGTTTNDPGAKVYSSTTSGSWGFFARVANGAGGIGVTNTSGTGSYPAMIFYNDGTFFSARGNITVSGSSTTYNTTSDYRLKENIAPMTDALAVVGQLKPCTYTWKADGSDGQGFIAHELAEVVPDAVTGEKDAVETYTDKDGSEQTRIKPQGIDTSFLVATLTAAIQEQQALIQSQADTITAMEARLTALEQGGV